MEIETYLFSWGPTFVSLTIYSMSVTVLTVCERMSVFHHISSNTKSYISNSSVQPLDLCLSFPPVSVPIFSLRSFLEKCSSVNKRPSSVHFEKDIMSPQALYSSIFLKWCSDIILSSSVSYIFHCLPFCFSVRLWVAYSVGCKKTVRLTGTGDEERCDIIEVIR